MPKNLDTAGLLNSIALSKEVGLGDLGKIDEFYHRKGQSHSLPAKSLKGLNWYEMSFSFQQNYKQVF